MRILGLRIAILILASAVLSVGVMDDAFAKKARSKQTKAAQKGKAKVGSAALGVNLQTDIQFGANTLHGQYQTPAEALAKVENEKNLNDLLIPRTHFKDRMTFEAKGNE